MAFVQAKRPSRSLAGGNPNAGPVGVVVEGVPELKKALGRLSSTGARAASRSALNAGMKPLVAATKREVQKQTEMKTGLLYKSVASRQRKNRRKGVYEAKAGLNVTRKGDKSARHAHLIALGTKMRFTKPSHGWTASGTFVEESLKSRRRGVGPKHPIVPRANAASRSESLQAMKTKLADQIQVQAAKARRASK